ncbi:MAG: diguanylate cyclase, partial [Anaerolineales bacterium]
MKVLVYEEDESRIELLRENLNQEDYDVIFARSGEALFVFLEDEMPDLIVSNFELPRGGYDLANAILARVKRPFPYVLFLTEKKSEKYVVDCLGPIPGDFVSLPLREEALQARIVVAEKAIALQEYLRSQDSAPPELAMYDPETNLLNKQAVFDRGLVEVSRSHRENQTVGVAMMELINVDAIRNQRGDELAALAVRFIANTLRANLRMYDIVGRWTPACFLVLIPGVPTENTGSVVTRLYEAVSEIKITLMDDSLLELQLAAGFTCANQGDELPFAEIVGRSE